LKIGDCNVINANYRRVLTVMEKLLADKYQHACGCPRCMNDVAAIALNYLPPHYFVEHGSCGDDHGSPWIMVESAVTEALDRVLVQPHHAPGAMGAQTAMQG
jgi:Late competence development protein ComFB